MMGRDSEQIWLRQSATFMVNGETRTVEIALPLRPGATTDEIESLLREADGGMERLARHLDARVAALRGEARAPSQTPAPPAAAAPVRAAPEPERVAPAVPVAPPQLAAEPEAERRSEPGATIAALRERAGLSLVRESPVRESPAALPPAGPPPATSRPAPHPVAPASGSPLTLQDFLKETMDEFGYTPRTVMEKLGVRSLSGVNYREALETLRRQAIRDGSGAPATSAPALASAQAQRTPAAPSPRYFDEELDEPEIVFSAEGDEDESIPGGFGPDDEDGDELLDELGLEEEIAPPPPPPPPPATRAASAASARPGAAQSQAPAAPPAAPTDPADEERARVAELIAQLRSPQAGGVPSSHQRAAYRNIVVQELGEEKAKALVAGLYRVTPERLGPEQIDELVSWGKRDTFADDADLALAALRAERAAQQASAAGQGSAERPQTTRAARAPRA
jgi:hypothetical protein